MLLAFVLVGAGWFVFDGTLAIEYYDFEDESYEDEDDMDSTAYPGSELARVRRFPDSSGSQGPEQLDQIKDALNQIMPGRSFDDWNEDPSPMNERRWSSTEEYVYDSTTQNEHFLTPLPMRDSNTTDKYLDQGSRIQDLLEGPHRTDRSRMRTPSRSTIDMVDREKDELIAYMNSMTGQVLTAGTTEGFSPGSKIGGVLRQSEPDSSPDDSFDEVTTTSTTASGTTSDTTPTSNTASGTTSDTNPTSNTASGTTSDTTLTSNTASGTTANTTAASKTTTGTTVTPKKTTRQFDIEKFLEIVSNLTYDYYTNLTEQVNETLIKMKIPTCGMPTTTTEPATTTEAKPIDYFGMAKYLMGKCFVCGLEDTGIPYNAHCADAFAGDFIPLVPQDPRAKGQIASFRKYCRYRDVNNFQINASMPRSIFGRWTGGCSVRWTDLSGVYTQRACRNRRQPATGRHFASKRMAKLEQTLSNTDNGCIISPVASLLPLSRGISLYARFHACVCTGNWCNGSARLDSGIWVTAVIMAWLNKNYCAVW